MKPQSRPTLEKTNQTWLQPWIASNGNDCLMNWHSLTGTFDPITLAEMENVALLNRLDTKFVMTTAQLWQALEKISPDYWMLEVEGVRLNRYRTVYFDTPAFDLYHSHVNRRPERYKVRSREYAETSLAFLEVKHHTRKNRTIKDRVRTAAQVTALSPDLSRWLAGVSPVNGDLLEPKLWNSFVRMTLVNRRCCERITLDLALAFSNDMRRVQLDGMAIAEVKIDQASGLDSRLSPFLAQMRVQRIHPRGFSKYAIGVAMLYEGVKKNTLKPRLLWVGNLLEGVNTHV